MRFVRLLSSRQTRFLAVVVAALLVADAAAAYQVGVRAKRPPSFRRGGSFLAAGGTQPGQKGGTGFCAREHATSERLRTPRKLMPRPTMFAENRPRCQAKRTLRKAQKLNSNEMATAPTMSRGCMYQPMAALATSTAHSTGPGER